MAEAPWQIYERECAERRVLIRWFNPGLACPKCGSNDISVRFHRDPQLGCEAFRALEPDEEHIDRACRSCGWRTVEWPLDRKVEGEGT